MWTIILTALIILLTLSAIAHFAGKQAAARGDEDAKNTGLTLLPGDIKWENQSGNVKVYFPVTTSIVLSIVLTILMRLLT